MRECFQSQESILDRPCHQVIKINVMKAQSQKSQIFDKVKGTSIKIYKASQKNHKCKYFPFQKLFKEGNKTFRYLFSQTSGGRRDQSYPQWYPGQYFVRTVVLLLVPLVCQPVSSTTLCCCSIYGNFSQYLVIVPRVHKCKAPLCATMYYCQWL